MVAAIKPILDQISGSIRHGLTSSANTAPLYIDASLQRTGVPLAAYDTEKLSEMVHAARGGHDLFRQPFGRIFFAYRQKLIFNDLKQLRQQRGEAVRPLSREDFEKKYGPPPWTFLNDVLTAAGLDFEVQPPNLHDLGAYHAKLTKKTDGTEVDFTHLSSGEKILASFANCIYEAAGDRPLLPPPKLIMFDEVDAPLHPSMARRMVKVIIETLVNRLNVAVIAATHSPSTVAVAPDEAIYIMKSGHSGLRKVKKGQALSLLTAGVPTLAINFDGRRQVFVESDIDARIYDVLFQLVKERLGSERSLSFLSTGSRGRSGDVGTGCDQVRSLVLTLEKSGNASVFGLIDWDGHNTPSNRVKVLSHGKRNGLENCLFDPLLVACLIARDVPDRTDKIGLSPLGGISQLQNLSPARLQQIADAVQGLVLGKEAATRTKARYAGGFELDLSTEYLSMDDHGLERRLFEALPALGRLSKRTGDLLAHMVESVVPDFVDYLPVDFLDVFKELLASE